MKKLLYVLPLAGLLLASCSAKNEVTGKLSNNENDGKTIVLYQSSNFDEGFKPIDSTTISKGSFSIKRLETDKPSLAYLVVKDGVGQIPPIIPFVNENGEVQITIDSLVNLKGTPANDEYQKFMVEMRAIDKQMYDLGNSPNPSEEEYNKLNDKQAKIIYDFVKSNIKNPFGEFLLITYASFINVDQLKSLIAASSPELQTKLKPFIESAGLGAEKENSFVGQQYIDISGQTPEGKTIALSDYVGKNKLVLIDFWASWCGPCIQEMPNVVEAYKKYKDKGFEIVGVSLDDNKSDWTGTVKRLDMTWPQMSDLKGWKSDLASAYKIQSIPFTILVNEKGEIVAQNLRGEELDSTLSKLLN